MSFNIHGYADDHQVMKTFKPFQQASVLTTDIELCFSAIKQWMSRFYLQLNDSKTQIIVFGPPRVLKNITIGGVNLSSGSSIRFISTVRNLGINMDSALSLDSQVVELKKKCFRTIRNIRKIRFLLSKEQLKQIVNALVVSSLDYCNALYYGITEHNLHQLQLLQNACAKTVMGKYKHDHMENDLNDLHWLNIKKRVIFKIGLLAYKSINGFSPLYLQELFQYSHHGHSLKLMIPDHRLEKYGRRSFSYTGPKLMNSLPESVKSAPSVEYFKRSLKTFLFNLTDNELQNLI